MKVAKSKVSDARKESEAYYTRANGIEVKVKHRKEALKKAEAAWVVTEVAKAAAKVANMMAEVAKIVAA